MTREQSTWSLGQEPPGRSRRRSRTGVLSRDDRRRRSTGRARRRRLGSPHRLPHGDTLYRRDARSSEASGTTPPSPFASALNRPPSPDAPDRYRRRKPRAGGATPEVVVQMHDCVHRRIGLDRVWHSMRLGHSWLAAYFMAACRDLGRTSGSTSATRPDITSTASTSSIRSPLVQARLTPRSTSAGPAAPQPRGTKRSVPSSPGTTSTRTPRRAPCATTSTAAAHVWARRLWQDRAAAASDTPMHQVADAMVKALGASNALIMPVGKLGAMGHGVVQPQTSSP